MPGHFKNFIENRTSSGVVMISQGMAIGDAIEEIIMIWSATDRDEWLNRIAYLPY